MQELSILDFAVITQELKAFVGGTVNKIWQAKEGNELEVEFFNQGVGRKRVVFQPGRVFTTEQSRDHPMKPPDFCMYLRKHLGRAQITGVEQKRFDRILHITFSNGMTLVCELFGNGNFILVNENDVIENAMIRRSWKHRDIFKGEEYIPPQTEGNQSFFTWNGFTEHITENSFVSILAQVVGSLYAEEILCRADVDPDTVATDLTAEEQKQVFTAVQDVAEDCTGDTMGYVYYTAEKEPVAVAATQLHQYRNKDVTQHDSLLAAVNTYIQDYKTFHKLQEQQKQYEQELAKLKRIKEQQEQQVQDMEQEADRLQTLGDALYEDYSVIEELLTTLRRARQNMGETEVMNRLQQEQARNIPEAQLVEDVDFAAGTVTLAMDGDTVELRLDQSVEKNAERFYEEAKHARSKISGAEDALKETEEELAALKQEAPRHTNESEEPVSGERQWFERFRWFKSSQDVLVIAGRDADQNEDIVKKQANADDAMFHAEIQGSPFTLIPGSPPENTKKQTLEEAAAFTAAMSSAWRKKMGSIDVYMFHADQAVKVSGLPKGAFQIQGDRTYYRDLELRIAVGVYKGRPMAGPVSAVNTHCDQYKTVAPGEDAKEDVAAELQTFFQNQGYDFEREELIQVLPPGTCTVTAKY